MQELRKEITAVITSFSELSEQEQKLFEIAAQTRNNAQAPYSHYKVGTALLCHNEKVYSGCNVERASYSQTTHAEQNAIDSMVTDIGPAKIETIAIVGAHAHTQVLLPPQETDIKINSLDEVVICCAYCLQIIWENCFHDPNVKLMALLKNGKIAITSLADVFPMRFGPAHLGVNYQELQP